MHVSRGIFGRVPEETQTCRGIFGRVPEETQTCRGIFGRVSEETCTRTEEFLGAFLKKRARVSRNFWARS